MIFFFVLIFQEFFTAKEGLKSALRCLILFLTAQHLSVEGLFQQIGEILGMKVTATVS